MSGCRAARASPAAGWGGARQPVACAGGVGGAAQDVGVIGRELWRQLRTMNRRATMPSYVNFLRFSFRGKELVMGLMAQKSEA